VPTESASINQPIGSFVAVVSQDVLTRLEKYAVQFPTNSDSLKIPEMTRDRDNGHPNREEN